MEKMTARFIICILIMALSACGGSDGGGSTSHDEHHITYEVSTYSTSPVYIRYIDGDGETVELPSVYVTDKSWKHSFYAKTGTELYLYAELRSDASEIFYTIISIDTVNVYSMSQKGGTPAELKVTVPAG